MKIDVSHRGISVLSVFLLVVVSSLYSVSQTEQEVSKFEDNGYTVITDYSDCLSTNNRRSICWRPTGLIEKVKLKDSNLSYHVYQESYSITVPDTLGVTFFNYTKSWYKSGRVSEQIVFNNDEFAVKEYYYENGTTKMRGAFRFNKRQGIWSYWNESGELVERQIWNNGELISSTLD